MTEEEIHKAAKKVVKDKKDFKKHLGVFMTMMGFFFILNMLTTPDTLWFFWPMLGWGIGIVGHYQKAYGMTRKNIAWENDQYDKERKKIEDSLRDSQKKKSDDFLELDQEDKLELEDFKELRKEWDDSEIV